MPKTQTSAMRYFIISLLCAALSINLTAAEILQ